MPISTRSQISASGGVGGRLAQETPTREVASGVGAAAAMRDPHRRLKEKMQALTLLYEQHRQSTAASRLQHHPSVDLLDSGRKIKDDKQEKIDGNAPKNASIRVMKENSIPASPLMPPPATKQPIIFPTSDTKMNYQNAPKNFSTAPPSSDETVNFENAPKFITKAPLPQPARRLSEGRRMSAAGGKGEIEQVGSRIMVFVRLRPMAKKEKEAGSRSIVKIVNRKDVYLTEFASETDYLRLKRLRGRHFCFDAAFPDSACQQEVYSATTAELVEGVLQGRNGSVFCYGATGAGKTYTMLGTMEKPGVMVLAIKDLFSKIRQRSIDGNHSVHLSYLEVYNETVRDLLSPGRPLVLREDKQGILAAGLTQYRAYSTDEVMALLQQGNMNRTTEPTRMNETSSRSHAILQVVAEFKAKEMGCTITRVGKLSLIDLAGSERAVATDQRTQRSIEGANINRSLLALSSCINALVEGKKHIPYRNSKLTQLLKDSLGGPCNTVMIANISPGNLSFGETQNTLHWADRAKEIRTKGCIANEEVMEVPDSATDQARLLLETQKENSELRQHLARLQQKLLSLEAQSLAANSACTPTPAPATILHASTTPCTTKQRKAKRSLLASNCFSTPEHKKKGNNGVNELEKAVKMLEADMERMKKEHALQIKRKDGFIRELQKAPKNLELEMERMKRDYMKQMKQKDDIIRELISRNSNGDRVVTRASLRKAGMAAEEIFAGELKSPGHRFTSPVAASKKRSFWDITTANSPSVISVNGRKTRSHVASEATAPPPSMLLQPGFARQNSNSSRK